MWRALAFVYDSWLFISPAPLLLITLGIKQSAFPLEELGSDLSCFSSPEMFRNRRRREALQRVFSVVLRIHQLDSIPSTSTSLYVQWALPDRQTGRTKSKPVEAGNLVQWHEDFSADVTMPSDPSDSSVLQPCVLRLFVRSERRRKAGFEQQGLVEIDLADVADTGRVSRSFLLRESPLNCTLKVSLRLHLKSGEAMFRSRSTNAADNNVLVPNETAPRGIRPLTTTGSSTTAVSGATDLHEMEAICTDLPSVSRSSASSASAASGAKYVDSMPLYTMGDLEAVVAGRDRGRGFGSDVPEVESKFVSQRSGNGTSTGSRLAVPPRRAEISPLSLAVMTEGSSARTGAPTKFDDDKLPSLQRYDEQRHLHVTPPAKLDSALRCSVSPEPLSPSQTLSQSRAGPPLSPRSPSGSVAAKVLDYLSPEAVQSSVYEDMRLQRIRKEVPPKIVETREPVAAVLGRVLESLGATSGEAHSTAQLARRSLGNLSLQ